MRIETILEGLIDTHSHPAPSPMPRQFDAATGARDGWNKLRMEGMVFKCHHHNTQMDALAQQQLISDIPTQVFGAVALNSSVGGLNLSQVQMCLGLGGKIVYLPTVSSRRHISNRPEHKGFPRTSVEVAVEQVSVVDDAGSVVPELLPIFDLIAEHDAVLNGGHLHPEDIRSCFAKARERGVKRFAVSHPDFVIEADPAECNEYVEMGAFIEHELHMYDPGAKMQWPVTQLKTWIDAVGVENTVIGSDLGQRGFPWPADAFIRVAEELRTLGFSDEQLRTIFYENPRRLINVD